MRSFYWVFLQLFLFGLLAPISAHAQRGALTAPRNLDELTAKASVIVVGRVVSAAVEPHPDYPNLMTTVVTLRVSETLKGTTGATYTFRQFIWDIRDRQTAQGYRRGQEVLLFMNAENANRLTSPVGLEQGRFSISQDREGKSLAVNGRGNVGLFQGMATAKARAGISAQAQQSLTKQEPGPLSLEVLKQLVQTKTEAK
jgi:hypothetical protein